MIRFLRILRNSFFYTLGGLVAGCILVAIFLGFGKALASGLSISNLADGLGIGLIFGAFAVVIYGGPAVIYGALIYAALLFRGYASYITITIAGAAPGLAIVALYSGTGKIFVYYGISVACCTHSIALWHIKLQGPGANNSFKPNTLRSVKCLLALR